MHKLSLISQPQLKSETTTSDNGFRFNNSFLAAGTVIAANDSLHIGASAQLLSSSVFRVTNMVREDIGTGKYRNEATIFCNQASLKVDWIDTLLAAKIHVGQIVSP